MYLLCYLSFYPVALAGGAARCASTVLRPVIFNKKESECETPLDYWLYNLKHMEQLETLSFLLSRLNCVRD